MPSRVITEATPMPDEDVRPSFCAAEYSSIAAATMALLRPHSVLTKVRNAMCMPPI
jgi:hypothetical protein